MRQELDTKSRVQLRVEKSRWILDVDGKPVMVARDGRWLRRFAEQIRRALSGKFAW